MSMPTLPPRSAAHNRAFGQSFGEDEYANRADDSAEQRGRHCIGDEV